MKTIDVLGIGFHRLSMTQAVTACLSLIDSPSPAYVVTPNAEIAYAAQSDASLMAALNGAELVLADGIGIIKGAKKLGRPLPERVPGVEVGPGLFDEMQARGKTLFLLGGKPGVAELAAQNIQARFPLLRICGTHDGYFKDDSEVLPQIQAAAPDVIFVCFGAPKQELWMQRNRASVGQALMLGLGGTLDHLAGLAPRAPRLLRRLGLEWLYRLLSQPSRWRRYLALPRFLGAVSRQKKKERRKA